MRVEDENECLFLEKVKQNFRVAEDKFVNKGEEVAVLIGKIIFGGGKFENFVLL